MSEQDQNRPKGISEHPSIAHETASHEPASHAQSVYQPPPGAPGEAVIAIAHTTEKHRSIERITALVCEALAHLGGMSRFVNPGQTVLIKPNQTVYYPAEDGCTTDPVVVGAVIRLAKEAGAGKVQVAESSGGFFNSILCMKITGMAAMAEREGAELVDLGRCPTRRVEIPGGLVVKNVPLPAPLLDADVIIDCPKAKNHHVQPISGALKNWVGAVNAEWRQYNHGDPDMFGRFMDIMSVTRPHLVVCDALIAGEGDGPIANLPHWCGCILAGDDPVAMDVSIARLLKHDWKRLQFAPEAVKRGIGIVEPIRYLGRQIEDVAIDAWHGHKGFDYLPVNFLVGEGVTLAGTIGHVKSVLDSMLRRGELAEVMWLKGTPTIMIGAVEDPTFEQHLKEGPYIVFDDAALPKYKNDPRVYFVPGHPVLRSAMPQLQKGFGASLPGQMVMKAQQWRHWLMDSTKYGSPTRKAITIGENVAGAVLGVAAFAGAVVLLDRMLIGRNGRDGHAPHAARGRSAWPGAGRRGRTSRTASGV
ncbi:MAG TPA: DUF362 domain-containing protein [Tepidisphaeraceae bacterium]|nr:DUF362 domain-containing protein [Tepidisphaeraceae bacterium]